MTLRLSIENVDRLPDGGPVRIEVKARGLDLGRDSHLDWTLPDPGRSVSGKHCEIRYRDGGYWLHDVSTNGTFVNGAEYRLDAPHLLRDGDRLGIGPYLIAVSLEEGRKAQGSVAAAATSFDDGLADVWGPVGEAAAPETAARRHTAQARGAQPDFLDFASLLEAPKAAPAPAADPPRSEDDWLTAISSAPPAAVERNAPEPRKPAPARPAVADPPPSPPSPVAPSPRAQTDGVQAREILDRIARAAGVPQHVFSSRNPDEIADEIGALIRMTTEHLAQMLASRAESIALIRSSNRTMIRAVENNPLKFASSPAEALAIMFGPRTRNYLDAQETIERAFADLKSHQILTFGAMQGALDALFEDLAPDRIDRSIEPERGLGALISSRKARLWDIYVERWRAKTKRADGRLLEAFTALFAQAYDRLRDKNG